MRIALFASIALLATLQAGSANAASFSCRGPHNHTEAAICDNARLSAKDSEMAFVYGQQLRALPLSQRRVLRGQQIRWLGQRNGCGANVGCLFQAYNLRINDLRNLGY